MQKFEKIALIGIALFLVAEVMSIFRETLTEIILAKYNMSTTQLMLTWMLPVSIFILVLNIAISAWLYRAAQDEEDATPWIWALFGLAFGISGAILFFVVRVYNEFRGGAYTPPQQSKLRPLPETEHSQSIRGSKQ